MKQPNRIAALSGTAGGIAAVLLALLGAVDTDRKAAVLIAALLVVAVIVSVFLVGSQRWEALLFRQRTGTPDQTVEVTSEQARLAPGPRETTPSPVAADDTYLSESSPEDEVGLAEDPR